MSAFPNCPQLVKGGLVQVDADSGAVKKVIVAELCSERTVR
jgi:hypothetical protein